MTFVPEAEAGSASATFVPLGRTNMTLTERGVGWGIVKGKGVSRHLSRAVPYAVEGAFVGDAIVLYVTTDSAPPLRHAGHFTVDRAAGRVHIEGTHDLGTFTMTREKPGPRGSAPPLASSRSASPRSPSEAGSASLFTLLRTE